MGAVGNLVGYAVGTIDLVRVFGMTFGVSQFKQLTVISGFVLIFTNGVTSWAVTERVLISTLDSDAKVGVIKLLCQIITTILQVPPRI